jgi:hypothetical protein
MIKQYLLNKNESATVLKSKNFLDLLHIFSLFQLYIIGLHPSWEKLDLYACLFLVGLILDGRQQKPWRLPWLH